MKRSWIGPALLATFIFCHPAAAGQILIGGEGGPEDPPNPTEGAESEENWNPVVTCSIGPGQTVLDLLLCLENEIENPPPVCPQSTTTSGGGGGGPVHFAENPPDCAEYPLGRSDFNVTVLVPPPQRWGLEILRLDGGEIDRVAFRENDPGIQTTDLTINLPNRAAVFEMVTETPTGQGSVFLKVDSNVIEVTTAGRTPLKINMALQSGVQALGYLMTVDGTKVTLYNRSGLYQGIRRIQFRSTDPGITKSSLELKPDPGIVVGEIVE